MKSVLSAIILQLVDEQPRSGYDITKELDLTHAWTASHQQIYRECAKLQSIGAMQSVTRPNDGKPDSKIYSLTHWGEELLADAKNGQYKAIKLLKTHCESTVMLRLGNVRYFEALYQLVADQLEQYRFQLKGVNDPAEKLLIERSVNLMTVELDFANYALELIDPERRAA